mmetsp:Transcript_35322/g.40099  ORF Transcript_35322/g.40099 Transcript_35322/m.40099 type:complete len:123 (+) Transcript_35322:1888-2256(+)
MGPEDSTVLSNQGLCEGNCILSWNFKVIFMGLVLGLALSRVGRNSEALICYDRAIRVEPNNSTAYVNKGSILCSLGEYEEAIRSFDRAVELNPDSAVAFGNKGKTKRRIMVSRSPLKFPNKQ